MSLQGNNPAIEDDDINTTAPQSQPDEWQMPEPVFRRTSGKLPQGFAKPVEADDAVNNSVPPVEPAAQPSAAPISPPVIGPKSSLVKMILVLLGLGAMIAFIVVFLTVLYFFFLRSD